MISTAFRLDMSTKSRVPSVMRSITRVPSINVRTRLPLTPRMVKPLRLLNGSVREVVRSTRTPGS